MRGTPRTTRRAAGTRRMLVIVAALSMLVALFPAAAGAQELPTTDDPRVGLTPGYNDAGTASSGLDHIGRFRKQDGGLFNPNNLGDFGVAGSDLAFTGDFAIHGNFGGFQIHDISDPANPKLRTEVICPGGQGDPNVFGNLLFISVEQANGRIDCGTQGTSGPVDPERFRGIRIFDISDIDAPVQVGYVQTCRGSHTHRLVEDLNDPTRVFLYNHGTAGVRPAAELAGCQDDPITPDPKTDPNSSRWQIEVIEVPLAAPQNAAIVREARIFQDPATGAFNGLQNTQPGTPHPCASDNLGSCTPAGANYSPLPNTNTCHDITVYPEVGLAAGACQGNGLLLDISDPSNPVRIDEASDVNFSYWHSANFNNDGTKVMFTDEWGGGTGARCTANHRTSWGANALFDIVEVDGVKQLDFQSYYKLPVAQTAQENCVAHQANILPVPGRDIVVQAWYQGGISMFDWTDTANPVEIAYFDRGPINQAVLGGPTVSNVVLGGFWSGYWYNGAVYGAEIARGLDAFEVRATEHLSQNEIDAAKTVQLAEHNPMAMRMYQWAPSFTVTRAFRDQAERAGLAANYVRNVDNALERAERFTTGPQARAAVANLRAVSNQVRRDAPAPADSLNELADSL
jgi:hypothetical protein